MYYKRPTAKFGNKKVVTDEGTFDSKKEYNTWCELKLMEKAGEITDLQRQVKFVLIPAQYEDIEVVSKTGKTKIKKQLVERECSYIADFVFTIKETGETTVLDTKSEATITPEFKIKKKLMLWVHHIKVEII